MNTKNLHAVSLKMMLDKMVLHAGNSPHPAAAAILQDMRRLVDSVGSLAVIAENPDAEASQEARQTRVMKAASKLGAALPAVQARLDALEATTATGFELAFAQNSGLVTTERAGEIRSHLKGLPTLADRAVFAQELLKGADNESLAAIVFSPPYLTGLDAVSHSRLKSQIEQVRLPELAHNREVFRELSGALDVAIHEAGKAVLEFSNPRLLADIEQRAQLAADAEKRLASSTLPSGGM